MIPKALIEFINEPPSPSGDADATANTGRRMLSMLARAGGVLGSLSVGWAALASVAVVIAFLAFVVRVNPTALIVGLHAPFTVAAIILLAVPSWRRWLLSRTCGARYSSTLVSSLAATEWPTSACRGRPHSAARQWAIPSSLRCSRLWWSGKFLHAVEQGVAGRPGRSAIELLAMMAILYASILVGEYFFGKDYGWLVGGFGLVPALLRHCGALHPASPATRRAGAK